MTLKGARSAISKAASPIVFLDIFSKFKFASGSDEGGSKIGLFTLFKIYRGGEGTRH